MFMFVDPFVRRNLYAFNSLEEDLQKATRRPLSAFTQRLWMDLDCL